MSGLQSHDLYKICSGLLLAIHGQKKFSTAEPGFREVGAHFRHNVQDLHRRIKVLSFDGAAGSGEQQIHRVTAGLFPDRIDLANQRCGIGRKAHRCQLVKEALETRVVLVSQGQAGLPEQKYDNQKQLPHDMHARLGILGFQAAFKMKLTRREFGLLSAALPLFSVDAMAAETDVVVVGAGVAGLAAAQVIANAGRRVQVIEAAPRVGGRCYTDFASFGMPFDQGAMWLRDATHNPVHGFALLYKFQTALPRPKEILFANGRAAPPKATDAYERAYDAFSLAMAEAAEEDVDIAAGAVAWPKLDEGANEWLYTAASQIGALDMGTDLSSISVKDWFYRDEAEPIRLVKQGLGTLVARLAESLPVAISTVARRIVSAAQGRVFVVTNRGEIATKAVIVTPSIGVLASESISFEPGLTSDMQSALSGLQMGAMLKIALAFDANSAAMKFEANSVLLAQSADERGAEFFMRPFGFPMAICTVGGSAALDLEAQGERTQRDYAIESLRRMLGSNSGQGLHGAASTSWSRNPLTLGSVACVKPGHLGARQALQTPINDNVFLAGEALAGKQVQTVHGAYENGRQAARRVLRFLKSRPG